MEKPPINIRRPITLLQTALESEFVRQIGETYFTRVGILLLGLINSVFIARALGPEGRGAVAVATVVAGMGIQFGNLGLHSSNTFYVSQNRNLLGTLLSNSLVVSFGLGGIGAVITYIFFNSKPDLAPIQGTLLLLALIWIPVGLAHLLLQNLLLGINQVRKYNAIELFSKIATIVTVGAAILYAQITPELLFGLCLLVLIFTVIGDLVFLRPYAPQIWSPSYSVFVDNQKFGIKAYLTSVFGFLVLKLDLLILNYMTNKEIAGYYSVATSMADLAQILPIVIATLLFPRLSALNTITDKWKLTSKTFRGVLGSASILLLLMGVSSQYLITIIYGKAFLPAQLPFLALIPGILFYSLQAILAQFLASLNFPISIAINWGIALLINIALNFILIPRLGLIGAAASSSGTYLFLLFLMFYQTNKERKRKSLP